MDCIFCNIAAKSVPTETIIWEDETLMAFPDIHPKAPLHILVIPKTHVASVARLEADQSDMIAKLIYAAKHIAAEKGLKGYKLVFNVGREGGQMIDHLHLHLLGGWERPGDWKKSFGV